MSHAPSMQAVFDRLATLKGVPIFEIPLVSKSGELVGNNGDLLIQLGAERLFERCELTFVDHPSDAELFIMVGSGGMMDKSESVPGLFREYWSSYPDKPLWVLPSSYFFPNHPLTDGLPPRSADILLFCRERVSNEHMLNDGKLPDCCHVVLSHDTAFALSDSPLVEENRQRPGKHILILERDDAEHPSRFEGRVRGRRSFRQRIPRFLKMPLYPVRAYLNSRRVTEFRKQCEEIIRLQHPDMTDRPRLVRDISRKNFCTFDEFCQSIIDAEIVFTTRLHVGIFAAMLGKRTYMFEGPYHKIRAVYNHSMTGYENVTLVPWGERLAKSQGR